MDIDDIIKPSDDEYLPFEQDTVDDCRLCEYLSALNHADICESCFQLQQDERKEVSHGLPTL